MKNILIVDDESDILLGFKKSLENKETKVDIAETLDQAKELIDRKDYFCVITDLRLSGTMKEGGFEVLKHVRKRSPAAYVIIITGHGNASTMQEAYALGASEYFEKPVSARILKDSLNKFETLRVEKMIEERQQLADDMRVESANGTRTVYFTGSLTIDKAAAIARALTEILSGAQTVMFNVESLSDADVAGLQVLCAAHRTCEQRKIALSLDGQRSAAFADSVREAGFSRHAGCVAQKPADCLWYDGAATAAGR